MYPTVMYPKMSPQDAMILEYIKLIAHVPHHKKCAQLINHFSEKSYLAGSS